MTPDGNFIAPIQAEAKHNYVGFAAGSGITPIFSILKSVLEQEAESTFTLFYGNKTAQSVIFKEQIEALKNQYMDPLTNQVVQQYNIVGLESPVGGGDVAISLDSTIYMDGRWRTVD